MTLFGGKHRDPARDALDIAALRKAGATVAEIDALIAATSRRAAYNRGCADRERAPKLRAAFVENERQLKGEVDQLLELRLEVAVGDHADPVGDALKKAGDR